jgi:regulation of enolase protein 1 (concanavalin A-like superfamily)
MTEPLLHETFDNRELSPLLQWRCPPQDWRVSNGALIVRPDADTDYWQRTNVGFRADNGHLLYAAVSGDFVLSTRVRFTPANMYDQSGLMVRFSEDCWLKTSVEYEPDIPNRLGAVVTNHGYSDWSTQDVADDLTEISLRVRRVDRTYFVEYTLEDKPGDDTYWSQLRVATLHEDDGRSPIPCGLYACSPKGAGYSAWFEYLKIENAG